MKRPAALAILACCLAPVAASAADAPPAAPTPSLVGPVLNIVHIDRELDFYARAFGMTVGMTLDSGTRREYMLRFSDDPRLPGLILVHDADPAAPQAIKHGNGFNRIVLRIPDLAALAARLDAAGIAHGALRDVAHGYRMMMLTDPEGYHFELIQSAPRN